MAFTFKQTYEIYVDAVFQSSSVGLCPMYVPLGGGGPLIGPFSSKEPICLQMDDGNRIVWTNEYVKLLFADRRTEHVWWNIDNLPQHLANNGCKGASCTTTNGILEANMEGRTFLRYPAEDIPLANCIPWTEEIPLQYTTKLHTAWNWTFQLDNDEDHHDVPCRGCGSPVWSGDENQYRSGYWCSRDCAYDL